MPKGEQEKSNRKISRPSPNTHTPLCLLYLRKHINLSHTCTQRRTVGNTGSILWPKCVTEELNVNNTHTDTHTQWRLYDIGPGLTNYIWVRRQWKCGEGWMKRESDEEWKGLMAVSVPGCPLRLGLSGRPNCLFPKQQALWLLQAAT